MSNTPADPARPPARPSIGTVETYNWDALPREHVRRGVARAGFKGNQVMLVMNWLERGMDVNPHSHPFEQLVYIVEGTARFQIGSETVIAGPGQLIRIPPDVVHCAEPLGSERVLNLDVFSPIRDDYRHLTTYQDQ